jgi:hypothetical protein
MSNVKNLSKLHTDLVMEIFGIPVKSLFFLLCGEWELLGEEQAFPDIGVEDPQLLSDSCLIADDPDVSWLVHATQQSMSCKQLMTKSISRKSRRVVARM